jgi:hypothetical protein
MAENKTAVHVTELVIPAQVLHGTPADMVAELDLVLVALVSLRRTLANDDRKPVISLPDPKPHPVTGPLDWVWRRLGGRTGSTRREDCQWLPQ